MSEPRGAGMRRRLRSMRWRLGGMWHHRTLRTPSYREVVESIGPDFYWSGEGGSAKYGGEWMLLMKTDDALYVDGRRVGGSDGVAGGER